MACYRISHVLTCTEVGPMSVEWPLAPQGGFVQSHHSMPQEHANGECLGKKSSFCSSTFSVGDVTRFNHQECSETKRTGTRVRILDGGLRCVSWNRRGLIGSLASSQHSCGKKHIYLARFAKINHIICLQFLQAIQVLVSQFMLYGTFIRMQADRPSAITRASCAIEQLLHM